MAKILLENIEIFAFHGVHPEEKKTGNRFMITLEIELDVNKASKSDRLEDTLDYQLAFDIVKEEMEINSNLLEHVGNRILERIVGISDKVDAVSLLISKLNPPFGGKVEAVSIEMKRERER